jgi:hypothetical protein
MVATMNPITWAETIISHLERKALIGALLPRGGNDANERYQPYRLIVSYGWSGKLSAATTIKFKILTPENKTPIELSRNGWTLSTQQDDDGWGSEYEQVTFFLPGGESLNLVNEIHLPNRFKIRISVIDQHQNDHSIRHIIIENLLERRGVLHEIRVIQTELPELQEIRPYGIDEDVYYRAAGLIGFLNDERTRLDFLPFALLPERIRRPVLGPTLDEITNQGLLKQSAVSLLRQQKFERLFKFQADSISVINRWLNNGPEGAAILLTVGTAAGKTEAFLMPLLNSISTDEPLAGIKGVFVYPTKALGADQAQRFFKYLATYNQGREYPITIGMLDGDTPKDIERLELLERAGELRTPFSECPYHDCNGRILFSRNLDGERINTPICSVCSTPFSWIRVHRKDIREHWPNLFLTNPDMLHRQLSSEMAWMTQSMFGRPVHVCQICSKYTPSTHNTIAGRKTCSCGQSLQEAVSLCPSVFVFDEAHLFKGLFGSQASLLIARIRKIAQSYGHRPVMIGASATIADPDNFGMQLFGGNVRVIEGEEEDLPKEEPTRYHLFLMPIEVTVLNAVGHILTGCFLADREHNETNRILIFSDSKRTVYQLEASLPEFYATYAKTIIPETPPTRSHTGDLRPEERRTVELAFDRNELRVLLATQTLEVGVDFQNLQLELQMGATYSYNDYIQRVGRAGRRGVPALVTCVLRPQVPLDNYYFEHCRELVRFSQHTLDAVPLRSDNPFLIERHAPAALQDYLISVEPSARLMWHTRDAITAVQNHPEQVRSYLREVFIPDFAWDQDLIMNGIERGIARTLSALTSDTLIGSTKERIGTLVQLNIRASDTGVPVESDDFDRHRGISLSGELEDEDLTDLEEDFMEDGGEVEQE